MPMMVNPKKKNINVNIIRPNGLILNIAAESENTFANRVAKDDI